MGRYAVVTGPRMMCPSLPSPSSIKQSTLVLSLYVYQFDIFCSASSLRHHFTGKLIIRLPRHTLAVRLSSLLFGDAPWLVRRRDCPCFISFSRQPATLPPFDRLPFREGS